MRLALSGLIAGLLCSISPVFAADGDATAPVREVIQLTEQNWTDDSTEWTDIFSADRLPRLFSAEFADLYRQASEKLTGELKSEEAVDPFGYDIVTASQDGCPLQDVSISLAGEKDGVSDVVSTFRATACWDDEETRNIVTTVHFDVVTQDGRPVISDIRHEFDGETSSALQELRDVLTAEPVTEDDAEQAPDTEQKQE